MHALDSAAAADRDRPGEAASVTVERHDQRFVEPASVVSIGGVAVVMFDALQLLQQPQFIEGAFQLDMPLAMEGRRFTAPLVREALRHVPRDHALARQQLVGERLREPFFHLLVGFAQAWNRARAGRHARRGLADLRAGRRVLGVVKELALALEVAPEQSRFLLPSEKRVGHDREIVRLRTSAIEAVLKRLPREAGLQFDAGESLFSGRIQDAAVLDYGHRRILVER